MTATTTRRAWDPGLYPSTGPSRIVVAFGPPCPRHGADSGKPCWTILRGDGRLSVAACGARLAKAFPRAPKPSAESLRLSIRPPSRPAQPDTRSLVGPSMGERAGKRRRRAR